ncbi:MAG TPA: SURF1 family protein [Xanthobacteraceae bacterium]|jgi:surfeit locus 1 family protein|nr:SURF1 family protein [Xanthobacteraceae bacterium]
MTAPAEPRRRGIVAPIVFTLAAVAVLAALGTWQLERKAWKEGLIAKLESKLSAAPVALPPRERWSQLSAGQDEFRRVKFSTDLLDQEALIYTSGSAIRPDVSGPGYWVLSPARLPDGGLVIVNRGFVPEGKQDPGTRREGQPQGVVEIVGAMRWPEARGLFTPNDAPGKNLWFVRDPAAIAAAKGWGTVAPFYIDQEAPPAPGGLPKVGPLKPSLPNNHLQYAVTWYGLAFVVLISGFVFVRSRRQEAAL